MSSAFSQRLAGPRSRGRGSGYALSVLAGLCFLMAGLVMAPRAQEDGSSQNLRPNQRQFARQVLQAQRLMRRDSEAALTIFEELYAQDPRHLQLRLLLAQAYREVGRSDESESILRGLMADYPDAGGYREELVLTLLTAGRTDAALELLELNLASEKPKASDYESAGDLLRDAGRYDLVETYYRRGLDELPDADEVGRSHLLLRLMDQYHLEDRSEDILILLAEQLPRFTDPLRRERVLHHGERLLAESIAPAELLARADTLAASPLGVELAPVLSGLYLVADEPEAFADRVLQARKSADRRPQWLYQEGLRCLESDSGEPLQRRLAARRLFEALLQEERLGKELEGQGHYQIARIRLEEDEQRRLRGDPPSPAEVAELRAVMNELRELQPESPWATQLLVAELHYLRERTGQAQAADSLLRAWLLEPRRLRDPMTHWALELQLGENLMALGRFAEARAHYRSLLQTTKAPGLANWSHYRLAQLDILAGEAVVAQDSLAALAKADPGSPLANDALDLALLLAESQIWPQPVRALMDRVYPLAFGGQPAAAADVLLSFAREFPEDPSAAALLYHAGLLLERAFRGEAALAAWLLLADHHPEDFRAGQGLEKAARLSLRMGDRARAKQLVQRILEEHPDSPLLPGLRDLQEDLKDVPL